MTQLIDMTGKKFGKLTVLHRVEDYRTSNPETFSTQWLCECECGRKRIAKGAELRRGHTWNCGCERRKPNGKHNMSYTHIHDKWIEMKRRCFNQRSPEYKNYGARGITVCDEWLGENGAANFIKWAYENGWDESKTSELSIDRIDVDGNYSPDNCRFVGRDVQANNKRTCRYVTYDGETLTLKQMCKKYGKNYSTVHSRLVRRGYSLYDALFAPKRGLYKRHGTVGKERLWSETKTSRP